MFVITRRQEGSSGEGEIVDAKTQYVAACNTVETLLVNRKVADALIPALAEASKEKIALKGDEATRAITEMAATGLEQ